MSRQRYSFRESDSTDEMPSFVEKIPRFDYRSPPPIQSYGGQFDLSGAPSNEPNRPFSFTQQLEQTSTSQANRVATFATSASEPSHPQPLSGWEDQLSTPTIDPWYSALRTNDSFRVLEILPGSGKTIDCCMHTCVLSTSAMAYEALSYTWEQHKTEERIINFTKNGVERGLHIPLNLYTALETLRQSRASRFIWVDALCINQQNSQERSQQVSLMGQIFGGARRVIIWLGQQDDGFRRGEVAEEGFLSTTESAFAGICTLVNTWLRHSGRYDMKANFRTLKSETGKVDKWQEMDFIEAAAQKAASPLYYRRWFSRIWVIQEVVRAREAVALLGPYEIAWDYIGLAAAIISANYFGWPSLSDATTQPTSILPSREFPLGVANAYLMYRLSNSQTFLKPLTFSFHQILQLTRQFRCSVGQDRIYGLLGLPTTDKDTVAAKIIPDYTKTREEVYESLAKLILEVSEAPLMILSGTLNGEGLIPGSPSNTPTWLPQWHVPTFRRIWPIHKHAHFSCGHVSNDSAEIRHLSRREILVRGVVIDAITPIPEVAIQPPRRVGFTVKSRHIAERLGITRQEILSKAGGTTKSLERLAMTLSCGMDWKGYPVASVSNHVADLEASFQAWTLDQNDSPLDYEELLRFPPQFDLAAVSGPQDGSFQSSSGSADRWALTLSMNLRTYAPFSTSSGVIGMGPRGGMKKGDRLVILFGADVPFLLRPSGDAYCVVGECYVYDLMHGENFGCYRISRAGVQGQSTWLKLV